MTKKRGPKERLTDRHCWRFKELVDRGLSERSAAKVLEREASIPAETARSAFRRRRDAGTLPTVQPLPKTYAFAMAQVYGRDEAEHALALEYMAEAERRAPNLGLDLDQVDVELYKQLQEELAELTSFFDGSPREVVRTLQRSGHDRDEARQELAEKLTRRDQVLEQLDIVGRYIKAERILSDSQDD